MIKKIIHTPKTVTIEKNVKFIMSKKIDWSTAKMDKTYAIIVPTVGPINMRAKPVLNSASAVLSYAR